MHDEARIRGFLTEPGSIAVFEETASTSDEARTAASAGAPAGAAFIADAQTHGRGRGDHRWHSPPGQNIYLSVLLRPNASPRDMAAFTLAVGVGVATVVDARLVAPRAMIKWPNDVYVDGRKLAGILVEATVQGDRVPVVIVGVGLNVLTRSFPDELAETATSLALADSLSTDRDRIVADLITMIRERCERFLRYGLAPDLAELEQRDFLRGKAVSVGGIQGTASGIDDTGRLRVGDDLVSAGEVTFL